MLLVHKYYKIMNFLMNIGNQLYLRVLQLHFTLENVLLKHVLSCLYFARLLIDTMAVLFYLIFGNDRELRPELSVTLLLYACHCPYFCYRQNSMSQIFKFYLCIM